MQLISAAIPRSLALVAMLAIALGVLASSSAAKVAKAAASPSELRPSDLSTNQEPDPPDAICLTCEDPPPPPAPGPGSVPPPSYKFQIDSIKVIETEDNGPDELYVKANGQKIWGTVSSLDCEPEFGPEDRCSFGWYPVRYIFTTSYLDVRLYDEDWPDPDDKLGTWHVYPTPSPRAGTLRFNREGADYEMRYSICRSPLGNPNACPALVVGP